MRYADLCVKRHIDEHVGSKLVNPVMDIGRRLKAIPGSTTPLNDAIGCISKTSGFISDSDIRNFDGTTGYRMLMHPDDDNVNVVNAYIAYGMVYVIGM